MVAEKPSIAESIAKILSSNDANFSTERNGRVSVHRFNGIFPGHGKASFIVTSVAGHLFSTDFHPSFQSWDINPEKLFDAPVIQKSESKGIQRTLERLGSGIDYLVLWLDCDREGENICFEVMRVVAPKMCKKRDQQIFRAFFSAVTKEDIMKAMKSLGAPDENLSLSVDARQQLDLKLGVAFSRFQTKHFQDRFCNIEAACISYGPCQTPTLGFCVDRYDANVNFTPETFWSVHVYVPSTLQRRDSKSITVSYSRKNFNVTNENDHMKFNWERKRLFKKDVVCMFLDRIKRSPIAKVTSMKSVVKKKPRPLPLNTVMMLKIASKALGIGPKETMHIAENLYLSGLISYPRTETTVYPQHMDLMGVIKKFGASSDAKWCNAANSIIEHGLKRRKGGIDAGDHPPITPCRVTSGAVGSDSAYRLYRMICNHYLATLSEDCTYEMIKIELQFECGEIFHGEGVKIIDRGFTSILESQVPIEVTHPLYLVPNTKIDLHDCINLHEGQTKPPGYLAEHELVSLMEKKGIGTDASMAVHINNIQVRNYVTLSSGRTLIPTKLGIALAHGYHAIDPELVRPKIRAAIEGQCLRIAEGKAKIEDVLLHSLDIMKRKFAYFVNHIEKMDMLFEKTFSSVKDTNKRFTKCGKCRRYMKLLDTNIPIKLYCDHCDDIFNIPRNGQIRQFQNKFCPVEGCGYELLKWRRNTAKKSESMDFVFCPNCYKNPPFEGIGSFGFMKYGIGCMGQNCKSCLNDKCAYSHSKNAVCRCPDQGNSDYEGCNGVMILDMGSSSSWKMVCNEYSCNKIIRFHNVDAMRCSASAVCDTCGSRLLVVVFKKGKSPLSEGRHKLKSCICCDPILNKFTTEVSCATISLKANRRRTGRGKFRKNQKLSKEERLMSFDQF